MKKITLLALFLFGFFAPQMTAQHPNGWQLFEKVKFKDKFVKDYGMFMPWPAFTADDRAWEGKQVVLAGYIIPTADAGGFDGLILSKFPYSMCFFCGEAGLESVAILQPKGKMPDFKLDRPYVFKGKLRLNDTDLEQLNFIIEEAVLTDL